MRWIAEGDKYAMQLLFGRYNVRIYRFVARLIGDSERAEDVVSEVFLDVWRRADRFEEKSRVSTWLLAIARHKALNALRGPSEAQWDDEAAYAIIDEAIDVETSTHEKSRNQIIKACMTHLSPAHREVIDLVYYHEKSIEEVAQIVGAPPATVKTRMFYARRRLATLLASAGIDGVCTC